MAPDNRRNDDKVIKELKDALINHISHEEEKLGKLWEAVFGDKESGDKGIKSKVDEMYEMLIQTKGLKSFVGILIMVGALITTLKIWLLK